MIAYVADDLTAWLLDDGLVSLASMFVATALVIFAVVISTYFLVRALR